LECVAFRFLNNHVGRTSWTYVFQHDHVRTHLAQRV